MAGRVAAIISDFWGCFGISAMLSIGVLREASIMLLGGFAFLSKAVVADVKDPAPKPWRESGTARQSPG
jgi:hypothetical protein